MAVKYDAVVVGAGMVGALAANLLVQQGLKIAVVDKGNGQITLSSAPAYDARVSAISLHSQQLFAQIGAWQTINPERFTPYYHMNVWDGLGTGNIQFSCDDLHLGTLGYLVENIVLTQSLWQPLLQQASQCSMFWETQVSTIEETDEQVHVTLSSGQTLQAETVIAADGAHSFVRDYMGIATKEWDYRHHGIVATVEIDRSHEHTAWQSFGEEGILAFLPMPSYQGRHFVSIVWSVPSNEAEALLALNEQTFCRRLGYAISDTFQPIALLTPPSAIPLRQRHATQYVKGRVALIGDAAHTIHPLAGQGANLGFADAGVLAQVIGRAKRQGASVNERVLRRYQRTRMPENIRMAASMEMFKQLYAKQTPLQVLARNFGMEQMNQQRWLKKHIVQLAVGA